MDKDEYKKETNLNFEALLKNGVLQTLYYQKIAKALEIAWDTRDFEIKRYWQRATYYWAFITSIFIAYVYVLNSSNLFVHHNLVLFLVILIGCVFSLAWVLTNISSKFWQNNWEYHINFLESEISGIVYGTLLYKKDRKFHPSISKINFAASCIILLVWITLLTHNLFWDYIKGLPILKFILSHAIQGKIIIILILGFLSYVFYKLFFKKPEDDNVYKL